MQNFNDKGFNIHEYVLTKAGTYKERYLDAEKFILKILNMPWYKSIYYRLFQMDEDIIEFIRSRKKFEK
jgi:hypothetical protein